VRADTRRTCGSDFAAFRPRGVRLHPAASVAVVGARSRVSGLRAPL
jgi:hypothetical protein